MNDLWQRLKQRKLVQWAVAYAAAAFALLQGMDMVGQKFGWPDSIGRILIIASCVGFLITLVLAWYHGERGQQKVSATELFLLALLLVIGGGLLWKFAPGTSDSTAKGSQQASSNATIDDKSIAVLPFENLSANKDNEYFVSGMQDMILTSLSKIGELKVISRTSTEKYASRPENLRQVAAELGVAHILEGSVQRVGDQMLINLQLIDARSDTHLWAESYDRNVADVFSVEREVAGTVADALRAKLLPAVREDIARAPTKNQQAYDLFLRAEYEMRKAPDAMNDALMASAVGLYQQAIATDPQFALAYAKLAQAQLLRYWTGRNGVPKKAFADAAQDAARRAKQLAPDLPEADLAIAEIQYRVDLDYPGALASFDAVLARRPQSVDALRGRAQTLRRLGRFDASIQALSTAVLIDPRDDTELTDRGVTEFLAGYLGDAQNDFSRALSINPGNANAALRLSQLFLYRDGDSEKALRVLDGQSGAILGARVQALLFQRRFDAALAAIANVESTEEVAATDAIVKADVLALSGRVQDALNLLQPKMVLKRKELAALPVNSGRGQGARLQLATAEAWLGNERQALHLVQEALQLLPPEKDLANGSIGLGNAARVYGILGHTDLLLPLLARIRALKGTDMNTSAASLRLDPVWDKVRSDPGFQAEIARFAEKQAKQAKHVPP